MAVYKVPQDVEAEDKLLGPFSFKQFIFLIISLMGVALAWGAAQIMLPLAILPLPIIILFGALALPLRKDQPTEVYLAALISFLVKPRKRVWEADGISSYVKIVDTKSPEGVRLKELSHDETEKRLEYLANLVDSRGWSVRGVASSTTGTSLQDDVYLESQQIEDSIEAGEVAQTFETMLDQADTKRRQNVAAMMSQPASASTTPPIPNPYASLPTQQINPATDAIAGNQKPETPTPDLDSSTQIKYSPYPESMRQAIINPTSTPTQTTESEAPKASQPPTSPDIINLANNSDLSIETIAHEAKRIREKEEQALGKEEVVISLR